MRPTETGNSAVDASVGTTWERPKQVSWRNVLVDYRFKIGGLLIASLVDDDRVKRMGLNRIDYLKWFRRLGSGRKEFPFQH